MCFLQVWWLIQVQRPEWSWNTARHKSRAKSHSPYTSVQTPSPAEESITDFQLYVLQYSVTLPKRNLRWKNPTLEKAWFMKSEAGRVPSDHCCLEACSQDSWSFGYANFIWRLTTIEFLAWTKALEKPKSSRVWQRRWDSRCPSNNTQQKPHACSCRILLSH